MRSLWDDAAQPSNAMSEVPLRDYVDQRLNDANRAVDIALSGHEKLHEADQRALQEARVVIDARLEKLNELRQEVTRDRGEYLRNDVYDSKHENLIKRIQVVESWRN